MAEQEDPYKKFQQSMEQLHGNLHILNQAIPVEEQTQYFKFSQKVRFDLNEEMVLCKIEALFDPEYEPEFKRRLLLSLAALDKVEAYRAIEKYNQAPDDYLKNWAVLALEESKMNLQKALSDEEQIFISTGLGGRDNKLRFFVVFFTNEEQELTDFQFDRSKKELLYTFEKYDAELELVERHYDYFTVKVLFPYVLNMKDALNDALYEINQYGNFLRPNILITNIKEFNSAEIAKHKNDNRIKNENDQNESEESSI